MNVLPGVIGWGALRKLVNSHPTDLIVVAARWDDAHYQETFDHADDQIEMLTLGFVHRITQRSISLSQEMDEYRDPRHVTTIPKKYITVLVLLGAIPTQKEPDAAPHSQPEDPAGLPA